MSTPDQLNSVLADRYVVERLVGEGGMATVYLARDLKHNRKVALKVLKPDLGAVVGVERFLSEIQVTANLQHPNLLPLFDSGAADGLLYYVMPYVEGESLRARLTREKQLPIDEAVHIGVAVANALEYAHRHGVIHRDLKPENILLQAGQPVVADFGIALAVSNAGGARITQTGLSLGTPQYMSPEQATGDRAIDARSDIYSLGAVMYEMLTGDPPHSASTAQAVIAKVLTERPQSVRVGRDATPEHVEHAIAIALEKLPPDRWASAAELADALEGKATLPRRLTHGTTSTRPRASRGWRQHAMVVGAAAVALLIGAGLGAWISSRGRARVRDVPFHVALSFPLHASGFTSVSSPLALIISPDGRNLVYGVNGPHGVQLAKRSADDLTSTLIPGTEDVYGAAISPDGKWIAFLTATGLKKVPIDGGATTTIAPARSATAVSWGGVATIVLADANSLTRVPAAGGVPHVFARPDSARGERAMRCPHPLPDDRTILYESVSPGATRIGVTSFDGKSSVLDLAGTCPLGMIDDLLIYGRSDGVLMAVPFDVAHRRTVGEPVALANGVGKSVSGWPMATLSTTGTLIYYSGPTNWTVSSVDARRGVTPLFSVPGNVGTFHPAASPDGKRVAVSAGSLARSDVWVYDIASGALSRLTSEDSAVNHRPVWSADGARLFFLSDRPVKGRSSAFRLWSQVADGSAPATLSVDLAGHDVSEAEISRDGRFIVVAVQPSGTPVTAAGTGSQIWYRGATGDTTLKPLLTSAFDEYEPSLSPDGRWLAYVSNESGASEIYVRAFPGPPSKTQVSSGGGTEPRWAPDGRHVYYRHQAQIWSATVATSPTFSVVGRDVAFREPMMSNPNHQNYDVTRDGALIGIGSQSDSTASWIAVVNWADEVRARVGKH